MRVHNLSVISISKASDISRATLYNKKLLVDYANKRRKVSASSSTRTGIDLRNLAEFKDQIEIMHRRDGELVLAQMGIGRINKRIESLEAASDNPRIALAGAVHPHTEGGRQ